MHFEIVQPRTHKTQGSSVTTTHAAQECPSLLYQKDARGWVHSCIGALLLVPHLPVYAFKGDICMAGDSQAPLHTQKEADGDCHPERPSQPQVQQRTSLRNTWPRWPPHLAHVISVRAMPMLLSVWRSTAPGTSA